ncbi:MAG TPA: methyltransferase [Candidatus Paceibacterota bacterium]
MIRSLLGNIVIGAFFLLFVLINVREFNATGDIGYALAALNEGIYVALFLVRERAVATSTSAFDWGVAFSATFLGTLLRPAHPSNILLGTAIIAAGVAINIVSVLFLNRSIGVVPAERSIKTAGMYRLVRHPMYSSEIVSLFGYVLINISLANMGLAIATTVLMLMRINREELFLSKNEKYKKYAAKTPWKLVPFVY